MAALEHLEPGGVFHFFEQLCAIPHGSRNTKTISDWCVDFARERGLAYWQDSANNVMIIKAASPGYENAPALILQGHLDMVCEKEPGCPKDMDREGLDLSVEGDSVCAVGTTLGGDDGIAVAMALAVLDDDALPHPRLEVVLTTEEEIGMLGATALDASPLQGRQMVNLDSEEEGVFTVGCAGGSMVRCTLPLVREAFDGARLAVRIGGLTGGHSGTEINKGRANADMLLGRLLRAIAAKTQLRLARAAGGLKDNAIPTAAEAVVAVADAKAAKEAAKAMAETLRREYALTDPGLTVMVEASDAGETPLCAASTQRALCLLTCAPNGVQAYSQDVPDLVQTSLNLGVLESGPEALSATFCVRSAVSTQKEMLHDRLRCLTEQLGGRVEISGDYPAWEYRRDSVLRARMTDIFRAQYGREPKIEVIHAGVECGILCGKLPGLDCVSIGPDLTEIHTPREKMSISSVQRVWAFLLEVLKESK
ncbi:aminoacyl-histidine dipeptidase [Oscillibacter sp.]|uniref:aminoacyl-histidine dipeptidase n=1 Tax=Oscillibacter sp. TaxID=1945593 RepID=UPI00261C3C71|nr:aminoacyl-histidine dipeptidase [Oscillibacter sp.]MDD3347010.1 aminoacyl-histidine dipeptidase [Oscillibacter sp.]